MKQELVERFGHSSDISPSSAPNAPLLTEEQVVIAEVLSLSYFTSFYLNFNFRRFFQDLLDKILLEP